MPTFFQNGREIEMRVTAGFVTDSLHGQVEPADAAVKVTLGDKIAADVVIGIAETGIDRDRGQTFGDGFVITLLKTIRPAEEGVGFGGRERCDRFFIELYSLIVLAVHLSRIGFIKKPDGVKFGRVVRLYRFEHLNYILSETGRWR